MPFQKHVIIYDADGQPITAINPFPVTGTISSTVGLTDTELRATPVPVSGTVTATGGLTDTELRATPVPVDGPLTDTELRAVAVPVSAASLPLPTGAAISANQQTDSLTDTELRATPVVISAIPSLVGLAYDYIGFGYTGSNVTTITFKTGGAGGSAVATLALAYSGSSITSITKT